MAYEKLKEEMYLNVGGINQKAIDSATPTNDVLDLRNFGFERPGGWVSRPGYQLYVTTGSLAKINGIFNYERLTGQSLLLVGVGSTLIRYAGTSPEVLIPNASFIATGMFDGPLDILTFVNYAWGANGQDYFRYNGSIALKWYLPPIIPPNNLSATFNNGFVSTIGITSSVTYSLDFAYVNDDNLIGPVIGNISPTSSHINFAGVSAAQGLWQVWGFTIPPGYGISYIAVYLSSGNAAVPPGSNSVLAPLSNTLTAVWQPFSLTTIGGVTTYYIQFQNFTDTGTYLTRFQYLGSSVGGIGTTWYFQQGVTLLSGYFMEAPKYINVYNNMLIANGFSSAPSITRVSEIGQPQFVAPENFFETRTNDGDKITGNITFQGQNVIFKERSVHVLNGFSPDSLSLQEVTSNYGALSNRAIVTFENRLFFLDIKGIIEFNGANTSFVSEKLEPFFARMNVAFARLTATATYSKSRNEVWFAIPIDGSTVNNAVVVYDQDVDAWTIYDNFTPSVLYTIPSGSSEERVFFGNYTGSIFNFGSSLFSDNGVPISMMIQTRFHKRLGDSTQELWRRFYINNAQTTATTPITVNFIPNYGSASSLGVSVFANATFQNRIDFGLSAKTMSAKMNMQGPTLEPMKILGYGIESRYLRSV